MGSFPPPPAQARVLVPGLDEIRDLAGLLPRNPDGTWTADLLKFLDRPEIMAAMAVLRVVGGGAGFVVEALPDHLKRQSPGYYEGCDFRDVGIPATLSYALGNLRDIVQFRQENHFVMVAPDTRVASGLAELDRIALPLAEGGRVVRIVQFMSFGEAPPKARPGVFLDDLLAPDPRLPRTARRLSQRRAGLPTDPGPARPRRRP